MSKNQFFFSLFSACQLVNVAHRCSLYIHERVKLNYGPRQILKVIRHPKWLCRTGNEFLWFSLFIIGNERTCFACANVIELHLNCLCVEPPSFRDVPARVNGHVVHYCESVTGGSASPNRSRVYGSVKYTHQCHPYDGIKGPAHGKCVHPSLGKGRRDREGCRHSPNYSGQQ